MGFSLPQYATREDVKSALDSKESARNNVQIDRAIDAASRRVENVCNRKFYPTIATRYFDWPNQQHAPYWRLWLDQNEVLNVTSLVAGGVTVAPADYFLEPANEGPPYNRVDLNRDSALGFFTVIGNTPQRQIVIDGTFGYCNDTTDAGALAVAITDATATTCQVTDSTLVGVGDLLLIDDEYLLVTGRAMVDTAENASVLTALGSDNSITGVTADSLSVGEVILIDSERMLVQDVAGTTVTVKRAWDGSTLAAHDVGAAIYAPRTLTVSRGRLGTTGATHLISSPVAVHVAPAPVRQLALAYALDILQQEGSAYARTAGTGDNERPVTGRAIAALEKSVAAEYERKRLGRGI